MGIRYRQFKDVEEACRKVEYLLGDGYRKVEYSPKHEAIFTEDDIFERIRAQGNTRVSYREEIFGDGWKIKVKNGNNSIDYIIFRFSKK